MSTCDNCGRPAHRERCATLDYLASVSRRLVRERETWEGIQQLGRPLDPTPAWPMPWLTLLDSRSARLYLRREHLRRASDRLESLLGSAHPRAIAAYAAWAAA